MEGLNKLKVADLKAELKKRGLPVGGLKAQLVERLQEAVDAEKGDMAEKPGIEGEKDGVAEGKGGEDTDREGEMGDKLAGGQEVDQSRGEAVVEETPLKTPPKDETEESEPAKVHTPPRSPPAMPQTDREAQPPITNVIPNEPEEMKEDIARDKTQAEPAQPSKSPAEPTPADQDQKAIEETTAKDKEVYEPIANDTDTRKRKRAEGDPVQENPLFLLKRAKPGPPARTRSRTPEVSPHRIIAANQTPCIHPPTKAIYISCLSRPLNVNSFTSYITSLTSSKIPPTQVWLDSVKSHGYIIFANEEDASAVRDAMNGISWPPNEKRRELSVDFVPVNSIPEWIEREEAARGQRFEVVYLSHDGVIDAILRTTESREPRPAHLIEEGKKGVKSPPPIPTGPRASRREEAPPRREERVEMRGGEKVKVLKPDELFKKTMTKPWVYWQEVSQEVLDRRRERRE